MEADQSFAPARDEAAAILIRRQGDSGQRLRKFDFDELACHGISPQPTARPRRAGDRAGGRNAPCDREADSATRPRRPDHPPLRSPDRRARRWTTDARSPLWYADANTLSARTGT